MERMRGADCRRKTDPARDRARRFKRPNPRDRRDMRRDHRRQQEQEDEDILAADDRQSDQPGKAGADDERAQSGEGRTVEAVEKRSPDRGARQGRDKRIAAPAFRGPDEAAERQDEEEPRRETDRAKGQALAGEPARRQSPKISTKRSL